MQERIERDAKRARYWFASLAEMERYIATAPNTWRGQNDSETMPAETDWDLGLGYAGAMRLARDGWPEGARKAEKELAAAFVPNTPAPDLRYDFYGHMPSVPRYCAGAPDNMIRHTTHANRGGSRVVTLIVPINAMSNVAAKYMRNFGLGVAQSVRQMETDGTRVEVIAVLTSLLTDNTWRVSHAWRVKNADQPLDLAVLAFAIGHPAAFRRLGFALRERCAAPRNPGYGRSADTRVDDVINAPTGAIVINGMKDANKHAVTPAAALAYVAAQIKKGLAV